MLYIYFILIDEIWIILSWHISKPCSFSSRHRGTEWRGSASDLRWRGTVGQPLGIQHLDERKTGKKNLGSWGPNLRTMMGSTIRMGKIWKFATRHDDNIPWITLWFWWEMRTDQPWDEWAKIKTSIPTFRRRFFSGRWMGRWMGIWWFITNQLSFIQFIPYP